MRKFLLIAALFLLLAFSLPKIVFAGPPDNGPLGCGGNSNAIDTAIGCIPINDTGAFIGFILRWAIGIGGGIAFLLIVYSAFMIMSSRGNPERLKAGQELLNSAIAGLILLIFSIFILKVIGVDILKLPGFGQPDKTMQREISK